MKNKVVQLGVVRDMLAELDKLRAAITSGRVTGFHAALKHVDGEETIYLGGVYRENPEDALRAALRASAARVLAEDPPVAVRVI